MRNFVVAGTVAPSEAEQVWPWLGWVPGPWRAAATRRFTKPKTQPPLVAAGAAVAGHAVRFSPYQELSRLVGELARLRTRLAPIAHGWAAEDEPPPSLPGVDWRNGRICRLSSILWPFQRRFELWGEPAGLKVLLVAGGQAETAVIARFLAQRVGRLTLACPGERFRDRLAAQILTESGLAVITRQTAPLSGWDVAVDLESTPPRLILADGRMLRGILTFPQSLQGLDQELFVPLNERPVWDECLLVCLNPLENYPLPSEPSLHAVRVFLSAAERAGAAFSLA